MSCVHLAEKLIPLRAKVFNLVAVGLRQGFNLLLANLEKLTDTCQLGFQPGSLYRRVLGYTMLIRGMALLLAQAVNGTGYTVYRADLVQRSGTTYSHADAPGRSDPMKVCPILVHAKPREFVPPSARHLSLEPFEELFYVIAVDEPRATTLGYEIAAAHAYPQPEVNERSTADGRALADVIVHSHWASQTSYPKECVIGSGSPIFNARAYAMYASNTGQTG